MIEFQQQIAAQNQLKLKQNYNFFSKGKPFVKKGRYLTDISVCKLYIDSLDKHSILIELFDKGTFLVVYDHYQLIKRVGDGAYGVVFKAINKSKDNEFVAIKKISDAFLDPRDAKRILREIKLLKFCDHPNIIKLKDMIKPEMPTGYKDIYLVLEFMEIDLDKTINSEQALSPKLIKSLMWQLLNAIYYMHSADIIHRDIKPSNILLNKNCTLKLADMNLARKYDVEQNITEYVVTRPYRAPEILLSTENYSKPIDIWSVGCIFAEMMGRKTIFKGNSYVNQLDRIIAIMGKPDFDKLSYKVDEGLRDYIKTFQEKKPENFYEIYKSHDPLAIDLLYKMLAFDPKERWTVEQCLNHQYFNEFDKSQIKACNVKFDWSFDEIQERIDLIQRAIYNESNQFHQDEPDATLEEVEQHYKQQQVLIQQKMAANHAQQQQSNLQSQQSHMKNNQTFQMNLEKLAAQQQLDGNNRPHFPLMNPMNFHPGAGMPFFGAVRNAQVPQQSASVAAAAAVQYQQQMQNQLKGNSLMQMKFQQMMNTQQMQMPIQKDFGNPFSAHAMSNASNFPSDLKNLKPDQIPMNPSFQGQNPLFVPGLHNFAPGFHPIKIGQQEIFRKPNMNMMANIPQSSKQNSNDQNSPKQIANSENKKLDTNRSSKQVEKEVIQSAKESVQLSSKEPISLQQEQRQVNNSQKEESKDAQLYDTKENIMNKLNNTNNPEKEKPEKTGINFCQIGDSDKKGEKKVDLLKESISSSDEVDNLPTIPQIKQKQLTFGPEQFTIEKSAE